MSNLIKTLRFEARDHKDTITSCAEVHTGLLLKAADLIEAQAATIAELREALECAKNEYEDRYGKHFNTSPHWTVKTRHLLAKSEGAAS